ncbi:MFS general substrate transporter [Trichodelitschia bisporula]|uniref:MFS general substrate transporter n=1 Tax=Trichodelitschia bisporula TaxID=703511 RepID=A0A6G1HQ41_9PEZI|nr:MFS general substrate transporter [Trichodelitschia bisporula]
MGIQSAVGMKGNDFSWCGTAFFLGYICAQLPQCALLQRFPVVKVLGINACLWGVVTGATAAVQTPTQLIALRTLLGVFEAVVTPSLIIITSTWYKRVEGASRFGIWFCGLGAGQIVGGLISFAAQNSHIKAFQPWRLMFAIIGVANLIVAVSLLAWLPAGPDEARFLTLQERELVAHRLSEDLAGAGVKVLRLHSLLEAVADLQTWLLCAMTALTTMSAGVVVYYSSFLISGFGFDAPHAALLNMPSGAISIITTLAVTISVARGLPRWIATIAAILPAVAGTAMLLFVPEKRSTRPALLLGVYLVSSAPAVYAMIMATAGANYRGYTRKLAGGALIAASFSAANVGAPMAFQARDRPEYRPAKWILLCALGAAVLVAVLLRLVYGFRNRRAESSGLPAMSRVELGRVRRTGSRAGVAVADRGWRYSY